MLTAEAQRTFSNAGAAPGRRFAVNVGFELMN
jgi:hypothetical protein